MQIPNYVLKSLGLPHESVREREFIKAPPEQLVNSRKSFKNRARALLTALGFDPTPNNVDRISQDKHDSTLLSLNGKFYKVMDNEEILEHLELIILSRPERIPSQYLALFMNKVPLEHEALIELASILRKSTDRHAVWILHKIIEKDEFKKEHIVEIIDNIGLEKLFHKDKVTQTSFHGNNYVVIEVQVENLM